MKKLIETRLYNGQEYKWTYDEITKQQTAKNYYLYYYYIIIITVVVHVC